MGEQFQFIILDPRKEKRARIVRMLTGLGTLNFQKLPKLSVSDFPETAARATAALNAGRHVPQAGFKRRAWQRLLEMQYNGTRRQFASLRNAVAVGWNGLDGSRRVFMEGAKDAGAKTLYFELGPFPGRVTVDPAGVNFANALPRQPAPYLDWLARSGQDPTAWKELGGQIKQRAPDRPPEIGTDAPPLSDPFVFAPLQVPHDSQLRLFGGKFRSVESFVAALIDAADALPDGWHLRLKEHPSTPPFVAEMLTAGNARVFLDNATDTFAQVAASRGVVTINSSVGLEAMFFDKPVLTCGDCYWAIPGMAEKAKDAAALKNAFSNAANWDFDTTIRNAVMSFLDKIYYPDLDDAQLTESRSLIYDRLVYDGTFGSLAATIGGTD